jgi:hypothetical protein
MLADVYEEVSEPSGSLKFVDHLSTKSLSGKRLHYECS